MCTRTLDGAAHFAIVTRACFLKMVYRSTNTFTIINGIDSENESEWDVLLPIENDGKSAAKHHIAQPSAKTATSN